MNKDLQSSKVDWNMVIQRDTIYITYVEMEKVKVSEVYHFNHVFINGYSRLIASRFDEVMIEDGEIVWSRDYDGTETKYDRGKMIWKKDVYGNVFRYKYDSKGNVKWSN